MRLLASALAATALLLAAGCNGPSPKGKENRAAANARMNLVSSKVGYEQALQSFHAGQFDRALKEVGGAIAKSPDQPAYQVLLGRIMLETHRLEGAKLAFDEAIKLDPKCHEAHYYRAVVLERWSDDHAASEAHRAAFDADPTKVQYLLAAAECEVALGRLDAAKMLLEPKLTYFENNAAMHQLLGQIAMMDGDPATAVDRFRKAQLLQPEDRILLEELCRAQQANGDVRGALESCRRLQNASPEPSIDLLRLEARCLAELGRTSESRNVLVEITRLFPEDVDAWVELAGAAHQLGDDRRVSQCIARIVMLAPDRWEAWFFKGLLARTEGRHDEAIAALTKAVELNPTDALPRLVLGLEQRSAGRHDDAYRTFAGTLRMEPDHPVAKRLVSESRPATN